MRPASLSIITKKSNEVLLVLRKDVPVWVLPGGGIEENESPSESACRETWEETGIHIQDVVHVATYTASSSLTASLFVFSANPNSYEIPYTAKDEMRAFRFFPLDALPEHLFFLHKTIVLDYFSESKKPIEKPLAVVSWKTALALFVKHPWYSLKYLWTKLLHH
jgi:8-oxo-dGTP pyrophosphatase MutT (NUDIX family)